MADSTFSAPGPNGDYTIDQNWQNYTAADHAVWDTLYQRQMEILPGRAADEFMSGLNALDLGKGGIPDFAAISEELDALTGWRIVAVPGLVPDAVFFEHLANRRFPAGQFIRSQSELDYLQEPDVFHDVFGHVPMLTNPVFADYMEAYGKGGMRALERGALKNLAALYWYTVEFGLIRTDKGMRIYGAGIVSSKSESQFALEDTSPNRIGFDLERVMNTDYRIDDFQQTYFAIDGYQQLFDVTMETDFAPLYKRMQGEYHNRPDTILDTDDVINRGTQAHARP